jgi:hypothetical protein
VTAEISAVVGDELRGRKNKMTNKKGKVIEMKFEMNYPD